MCNLSVLQYQCYSLITKLQFSTRCVYGHGRRYDVSTNFRYFQPWHPVKDWIFTSKIHLVHKFMRSQCCYLKNHINITLTLSVTVGTHQMLVLEHLAICWPKLRNSLLIPISKMDDIYRFKGCVLFLSTIELYNNVNVSACFSFACLIVTTVAHFRYVYMSFRYIDRRALFYLPSYLCPHPLTFTSHLLYLISYAKLTFLKPFILPGKNFPLSRIANCYKK